LSVAILYSLIWIFAMVPGLRRLSPAASWHRNGYVEGDTPELEITTGTIPRILKRNVRIVLRARWFERRIDVEEPLRKSVQRNAAGGMAGGSAGRGTYRVERSALLAYDPLRLFFLAAPMAAPGDLRVTSAAGNDGNSPVSGRSGGDSGMRRQSQMRSDTLLETRPYVSGDNPQRISWNAFAHTGELHIRIGDEVPPPARDVLVVGDLRRPAPGADIGLLDRVLRAVRGTAGGLQDAGYRVTVAWSNGTRVASLRAEDIRLATAPLYWDDTDALDRLDDSRVPVVIVSLESLRTPKRFSRVTVAV